MGFTSNKIRATRKKFSNKKKYPCIEKNRRTKFGFQPLWTVQQIALILGVTEQCVDATLNKAIEKLKFNGRARNIYKDLLL